MPNDWTCDVVARMHRLRITNKRLASATGYTPQYISMVLNGKRDTLNAKGNIIEALKILEA